MAFRNRHKGETGIIVCNGPGLNSVPLEFLYDFPTFAANYISLKPDFIPTYLSIADAEAVGEWKGEAFDGELIPNDERIALIEPTALLVENFFVLQDAASPFKGQQNLHELIRVNAACFSYCPIRCLFTGGTTTYVNLQLAFYMGFSRIFIVGMDHDYSEKKHFSDDYLITARVETVEEERKVLEVMVQSYKLARRAYDIADRRIINLSHYSACNEFERGMPPWLRNGEYKREDLDGNDILGT